MAVRAKRDVATKDKPGRRNRLNMADVAYDQLEELIVTCALQPGLFLSIQDLQTATGGAAARRCIRR
jgi:DNA-binding GntR family transcriptional regulator